MTLLHPADYDFDDFQAAPVSQNAKPATNMLNATTTTSNTTTTPKPSANFDDLWSLSLGSGTGAGMARPASAAAGKSIKDLEKEKAMSGLWGGGNKGGAFGGAGTGLGSSSVTQSNNGADDLLL